MLRNKLLWCYNENVNTRKYLSELLNTLTQNEYSLKDSFDAANRINRILPIVKENEECIFGSLDVVSLFTNVPLRKSVNIILKRVYNEKLIKTLLSKRLLKKLSLDTCQETAVSFNNKLYGQKEGISMGGTLGPVLTNTTVTKVIVDKWMKDQLIVFYTR